MWDNQQAEYSGDIANTMLCAPPSGCTPVGGAFALGSTDPMDEKHVALFWSKVDRRGKSECWSWLGGRSEGGYGRFNTDRRTRRVAHRIAYELTVGPVPTGMVLDHLCRNRACVNPAHLDPVTNAENIHRGMAPSTIAGRVGMCMAGLHELSPANTYVRSNVKKRRCRPCASAAERARRARLRATRLQEPTEGRA